MALRCWLAYEKSHSFDATIGLTMRSLPRIEFGNPILRRTARLLQATEISTPKVQALIKNMRHTLLTKKLGVGLAAPQVGEEVAVSVIAIRPTDHRPNVTPFDLVIINPVVTKTYGQKTPKWEGCLSAGSSGLFAKVPRYTKVQCAYLDENGKPHQRIFEGLAAQVIQHEVDHLRGVLFMDHVTDTSTYMTMKEYKKRIVAKRTA